MSDIKAKLFLQETIKNSQEQGDEVFIDTSKGFLTEESIFTFKKPQVLEYAIQKFIRGRSLVKISQSEKDILLSTDIESKRFDDIVIKIIEKEFLIGKIEKIKNDKDSSFLSWGLDMRFSSNDVRR